MRHTESYYLFHGIDNNVMAESPSHGDPPTDSQTDFTTVTELLTRPRLAYLYTELLKRGGWTTTQALSEASEFSQSTVYDDLRVLRQTSLVTVREDGRERHYRAEPFKVGVITAGETQLTTITPTISAAIGLQAVDDDVAQFVDEYGVETLADVVAYVKPYIEGRMTERLAARELELSALVGMTILIALEDTVREMQEIDPFFEDIRDAADDGRHPSHEIQFDAHTRVIFEPNEDERSTDESAPDHTSSDV